ncbi:unnamed protein product [Prorocentrum cordatum]|nr:unnamed protein product [Polarella glacialis]
MTRPLACLLALAVAPRSVAEGSLVAWLASHAEDPSCEGDAQWWEVKRQLFRALWQLTDEGTLDLGRSIALVTRGVAPEDLARCEVGAAATQLFLQIGAAAGDPALLRAADPEGPWPDAREDGLHPHLE